MKNIKSIFFIIAFSAISCSSDDSNQTLQEGTNTLLFETIVEFDPNFLEGVSMGMTNSVSENSLYISSRNDYPVEVGTNREQIIKLNLVDLNIVETQYSNSDFITKRLFVMNNQLISVGGQFVNTYKLDIVGNPTTESHQKTLSKFKIANEGDTTFIIGGDFTGNDSSKIYKWNPNEPQNYIEFTTLPEARYGAGGVIANNNLYIFGGSTDNQLSNPSDKLYIIPLDSPNSIQELSMDIAINETFVQKHNNNIYISGESNDGNSIIRKFDTTTKTFEVIEHNLDDINTNHKIGQMSILNNNLYIVYGVVKYSNPPETGINSEWSILSVELN